jgi:hypothetical protein
MITNVPETGLPAPQPPPGKTWARPGITLLVLVAWTAFVIFLATMPRQPRLPGISVGVSASIGHAATHAILAALVYAHLATSRGRGAAGRLRALAVALAGSLVLGTVLEVVQREFVANRAFEIGDIADNTLGSLAGGLAAYLLHRLGLSLFRLRVLVAALTFSLIAAASAFVVIWDPRLPYIGDHWHARYSITVCGRTIAPLPGTLGGVHTHGDGRIHVHPARSSEEGRNANLALFFRTSGGELTQDSLTIPGGRTYREGDACPDGRPGHLTATVNGNAMSSPPRYVIRDEDVIRINFGP